MKKLLLILTVVFGFTVAQGQTTVYHSLVDTNSLWSYYKYSAMTPWWAKTTNFYFFKGDTIINTTLYKKLYLLDSLMGTTYQAGLREDSINKKVYINQGTNELLLYNFSANVGDTIMFLHYGYGTRATVDFIDSIQLQDGNYRRLFHSVVSPPALDTFGVYTIEGIGNLGELLGDEATEKGTTIL